MYSTKVINLNMFTWNSYLLLIMLTVVVVRLDAQRSCFTPNKADGQCVDYRACSSVTQAWQKYGKRLPKEIREYIGKSRCPAPNNRAYFVCCEVQDVQVPTIEPTPRPPTPAQSPTQLVTPPPTPPPTPSNPIQRSQKSVLDLGNQAINERGFKILNEIDCGEIAGNKVANGKKTKLNEFIFMALLIYDDPDIYLCGGSLITNRFVLTAAHCLGGSRKSPIAVRLGEYDYNEDLDCAIKGKKGKVCNPPVEDYGIEQMIMHPLYHDIHHDIGLLRLDRSVSFKDHIKPICLPIHQESLKFAADQMYILAGWGTTHNASKSSVLMKAYIPHHEREYCAKEFRKYTITDNHICAGGGENLVNSCTGDSGGPIFFDAEYKKDDNRYVQFGVVARGILTCGKKNYPNVYTKVAPYLPWLTDTIAKNEL